MRKTALISALMLTLTGCAASSPPPAAMAPASPAPPPSAADVGAAPASVAPVPSPGPAPPPATTTPEAAKTAQPDAKGSGAPSEVTSPDVFILYTGDVAMLVDENAVASTIDRIIDSAIAAGGHIGSRKDTSVSVVVPSAAFRKTFAAVEAMGEVTHRSIAAEDVSEEYHDADVRLANLKATRKRLEDFLAKAPNVTDMLTLERELERVVMEIDRVEGRMRFLREHTAFSTLTVTLAAKPKPTPAVAVQPPAPPPPPPPPPRTVDVPAKWLDQLGFDRLISGK